MLLSLRENVWRPAAGSVARIGNRQSPPDPDADLNGHLAVETGVVTDFIAAVLGATGAAKPVFGKVVTGKFSFDGDIATSADRIALSDFHMSMGRDAAAGSLALSYKAAPSIEGRLALPKLDLDKWLDILLAGLFFPTAPAPAGKPEPLPAVNASLAIDVAEMIWRKDTIPTSR
jgi:hypothetical protein